MKLPLRSIIVIGLVSSVLGCDLGTYERRSEESKTMMASQPNASNPAASNVNQPNVNQPNVNQPNVNQPNVNQPNVNQPNVNQPNVNQPNVNQPNVNQPNVNQSNSDQGLNVNKLAIEFNTMVWRKNISKRRFLKGATPSQTRNRMLLTRTIKTQVFRPVSNGAPHTARLLFDFMEHRGEGGTDRSVGEELIKLCPEAPSHDQKLFDAFVEKLYATNDPRIAQAKKNLSMREDTIEELLRFAIVLFEYRDNNWVMTHFIDCDSATTPREQAEQQIKRVDEHPEFINGKLSDDAISILCTGIKEQYLKY